MYDVCIIVKKFLTVIQRIFTFSCSYLIQSRGIQLCMHINVKTLLLHE